jgi:hypothetical protein
MHVSRKYATSVLFASAAVSLQPVCKHDPSPSNSLCSRQKQFCVICARQYTGRMAARMHAREHSGSWLNVTFAGSGHCVANQSSTPYQSLPVQLLLAQPMGSSALQKQS